MSETLVSSPPRPWLLKFGKQGTDPDVAVAFYENMYCARHVGFSIETEEAASGFEFSYRAIGDERMTFRSSSVSARRHGVLHPQRQYTLAWSVGGRFLVEGSRGAVVVEPGTPAMFPTSGDFHAAAPAGTQQYVQFDADFLEAVAVAGTGEAPRPLEFPVLAPAGLLRPLRTVMRSHAPRLVDAATPRGERAALDLAVAQSVLEAFCPSHAIGGGTQPVKGKTVVERAEEFMREHYDRPLTATDIAIAAGASVRTLQQAFLEQEQTSPMRWLRDFRMRKTRVALLLADPHAETVSEVARRHGFRHMGRFSGDYLMLFDEHPSEVLARAT
jgi:AraC-like DNA-binding protein